MDSNTGPSFETLFSRKPTVFADAPGRVNLIGEHTDYSDGFVLPVAIALRTFVELAPRQDELVRISSANLPHPSRVTYRLGAEKPARQWVDYVQGVTAMLRRGGIAVSGFDARITSELPIGSGLSSSAALEVSLLRALRTAFRLDLDDVAIAKLGRAAENDFVGAPVGIMDQMASSLAEERAALFLDTRSLEYEKIPLPKNAELLVIDSGVAHDHATGDYQVRRDETERAAELLGVRALRDVPLSRLDDVARLPAPLDRRAKHVITENARVLQAVDALREGDFSAIRRLFSESHASMRDDFEVSVPAVDHLVALAEKAPEVYGARLTGGGFGGAIVALVRGGTAREVGARIVDQAGSSARVRIPTPVQEDTA